MDHHKQQIRILRGCLFVWIGVSMVFAEGDTTTEATPGSATDMSAMGSTGSPSSSAAPLDDQGAGDHQTTSAEPPSVTSAEPLVGATADPSTQNNCHTFQCIGEDCYKMSQNGSAVNTMCPVYCEMFRHNSSFYEARCNDHCMHHMCNNMEQENCSVHCCSSNQTCFNAENNIVAPTTVTMTTAAATTTATTITYSDKKCRSFTCSGADCYKNQATVPTKQCRVGITHCELQKKVSNGAVSYEGGCSNTCATSTKSCASITTADCFQECCNATSTACCMMLDGQVHFNTASQINKGSLFRMFTCAFIVLFLSRYFSFSSV